MRIVHLAFEDHRRPGSGGGGQRTHEIDRRLARRHDVTVLVARYPGARPRVEDGVVYRPVGLNLGYFGSLATYHLALPLIVPFLRADLVIEDFAAPISSALVPLFARRPTVAVVQWMFAWDKSRRFKLPFFLFEEAGVRLHQDFVAVSGYIAGRILGRNPRASVTVVPGGVSLPADFVPPPVVPNRVVYLGRLEWGPKGLDHLVDAFARLVQARPGAELVVAGDGPDQDRLQAAFRKAGVVDRVEMAGRVGGAGKWALLASASALVMPSRYETFGLVAAEALATGTPVVGFEIPSLQEILAGEAGLLAPCYDTAALAESLARVLAEPELRRRLSEGARRQAGRFDWDRAAAAHEAVYLAAVGR